MESENNSKIVEVMLPKLGESIVAATVVQWLKQEGDSILLDEPLLEVATDKVNSEIPSPVCGILKEICASVDEQIEVGSLVAKILIGEESVQTKSASAPLVRDVKEELSEKRDFFSPAVMGLASSQGLTIDTLRKIEGSGSGGRITKKDVQHFAQHLKEQDKKKPTTPCAMSKETCSALPNEKPKSGEERIAMSGMRKMIAENMVRSFYEAPHASLVMEADVTEIMKVIQQEKQKFLQTHDAKLTITSFIVQAMTRAIVQFPMLNASLDGETIVLKRYVNVGIAVNIDKGLIVPVIKNCQERNLVSLAKALHDLSSRARSGKLAPQEVLDGTITLTNFGMTGALIGVPIIRYPEVAIIGVGSVQKRVVVREDDSFAVRQMVYLTLTFDHRVIDGIYGCQFLAAFKHHLESPSVH